MSLKLFRTLLLLCVLFTVSSCGYLRIDPLHYLIRSDHITSEEHEAEILSRAKLGWTEDGQIRVLYVEGTPYERGYQHGKLLRREVQDNLNYLYESGLDKFKSEILFEEAFERLRPFIPQDYIDEMHGLAHGARLPLKVVHYIHVLPSISEWGGKKALKKIIKRMMNGELATSCSNFGVLPSGCADDNMYTVRILDWGLHRISKLHEYPLLLVSKPHKGNASVNIGWVGFLGAISGMNEQGITLGEMGYGSPPNETLRGKPMPFLLREVLRDASNLADVRRIISTSPGTNSFGYLMSDGKSREAELYIRDRDRFLVFRPGEEAEDNEDMLPAIPGVTYGGHYEDRMAKQLSENNGKITPELLMETIIPDLAMKSNFQNVVYDPVNLQFWVSYSSSKKSRAAEEPYTFFDFGKTLLSYQE